MDISKANQRWWNYELHLSKKNPTVFFKLFFLQVAFERYQLFFMVTQKMDGQKSTSTVLWVFLLGLILRVGDQGVTLVFRRRQTSGFREQIYLERVMAMDAPAKEVAWQIILTKTKTHIKRRGFGLGVFCGTRFFIKNISFFFLGGFIKKIIKTVSLWHVNNESKWWLDVFRNVVMFLTTLVVANANVTMSLMTWILSQESAD